MGPRRNRSGRVIAALAWLAATFACASAIPAAPKPQREVSAQAIAELWMPLPPLEERDLFSGPGGAELAPKESAEYEFLSEKSDPFSHSSGYKVRDAAGRKWSVKLGDEVRPEVLASRIVWAVGYRQPPLYRVSAWTLVRDGERKPMPAARFRLDSKDFDKKGEWSWKKNPFVGTRPFNGLLALMAMIGNWDVEDHNTAVYEPGPKWGDAKRWFVVKDVGASFSKGGGRFFQGTRNDTPGFLEGKLIRRVDDDRVEMAWEGRQPGLFSTLPVADVRWIGERLAKISAKQWDDAFRAAGYDEAQARLLHGELERRIGEAVALSRSPGAGDDGLVSPQHARVDDRPGP